MWNETTIRWVALAATNALFGLVFWLSRERGTARGLLGLSLERRAVVASLCLVGATLLFREGTLLSFGPLLLAALAMIELPARARRADASTALGEWREIRKWSSLLDEPRSEAAISFARTVFLAVGLFATIIVLALPLLPRVEMIALSLPWAFLLVKTRKLQPRERAKALRTTLRAIGQAPQVLVRMQGDTVLDHDDIRVAWTPNGSISGLSRIEIALGFESTLSGFRSRDSIVFRTEEGTHAAAKLRKRLGHGAIRSDGDPDRRTFVRSIASGLGSRAIADLLRAASEDLTERRIEVPAAGKSSEATLHTAPPVGESERRLPPSERVLEAQSAA